MSGTGRPSRRQPQRIPPPIRGGAEPFEGEPILREVPEDLGLLLWRTSRAVQLWASLDASERPEAFGPAAHTARLALLQRATVPIELLEPLVVAATVLKGAADPQAVAAACVAIKEWAVGSSTLATALEFAQAGALANPGQAALNAEVAALAMELGDRGRAESWYRQSMVSARRVRDWWWYSHSNLALSELFRAQGEQGRARRHALLALRAATRHSLRDLVGVAHHAMVRLALAAGRERDAVAYANRALDAADSRDPALVPMALLLARHWMEAGLEPLTRVVVSALAQLDDPGLRDADRRELDALVERLESETPDPSGRPASSRPPRVTRERRELADRLAHALGRLPSAGASDPSP